MLQGSAFLQLAKSVSTVLKIKAVLENSPNCEILTKGKKMSYRKLYGSCLFFKEFTIYNKLKYKTLTY